MINVNIRAGDVPDLIRKTAEEFAGEFYEGGRSDRFRAVGLSEKAYIRRYWTSFVDPAVEILASMLAMPGVPDNQKADIYDAIITFRTLATVAKPRKLSKRSLN